MEKKIIAIALVLVLMVTVFVGCSKKYETTKINGNEFALVTDKEGNTIVDESYRVAFYVTDSEGNIEKDENGEKITNWYQLKNTITDEEKIQSDLYEMAIIDGWGTNSVGIMTKDDTDDKCYIKYIQLAEVTNDLTLKSYLETVEEQNNKVIDALKEEGYIVEYSKESRQITLKAKECTYYQFKVIDNEGNVIHYAENYYFVHGNAISKLEYACQDGVGYDEEFIFKAYIDMNFTFKN